jgi:hypothetical protein
MSRRAKKRTVLAGVLVIALAVSGMIGMLRLVNWYSDSPFGFDFALNSAVHSLCLGAGNPDFTTLLADLDRDLLKKVEMLFYEAVNISFLTVELTSTNSAQRVFHGLFSLRVLGSSHLAGSNQWTVII